MLPRASRIVADSGPSRSPSPSTRQAKASIASAADGRFGCPWARWMAASSYNPITWLSDDDFGRNLGDAAGLGQLVDRCLSASRSVPIEPLITAGADSAPPGC